MERNPLKLAFMPVVQHNLAVTPVVSRCLMVSISNDIIVMPVVSHNQAVKPVALHSLTVMPVVSSNSVVMPVALHILSVNYHIKFHII
jgi:hypothetical protein